MLGRRCYLDLIPKYCKWFTGKFVAARGENWRSVVGSLKVECLSGTIFDGTPRGKFRLIIVTKKLLMRVTKILCACNADNCCIISSRTTFHKKFFFSRSYLERDLFVSISLLSFFSGLRDSIWVYLSKPGWSLIDSDEHHKHQSHFSGTWRWFWNVWSESEYL